MGLCCRIGSLKARLSKAITRSARRGAWRPRRRRISQLRCGERLSEGWEVPHAMPVRSTRSARTRTPTLPSLACDTTARSALAAGGSDAAGCPFTRLASALAARVALQKPPERRTMPCCAGVAPPKACLWSLPRAPPASTPRIPAVLRGCAAPVCGLAGRRDRSGSQSGAWRQALRCSKRRENRGKALGPPPAATPRQ